MFFHRVRLFSLFGFEVSVDASWLLLAILVTWTLAVSAFPQLTPGLDSLSYWLMGAAATAGLLLSIVFHEMAHSLVARHYGIPIRGITLFIFGGVAELTEEPAHPRDELLMAAAGPAASILLAACLFLLSSVIPAWNGPGSIVGVLSYLALINGVLALFNLVPAFPLDGGRVFRAALWWWRGDHEWATRIAAGAGSLFGIFLIVLGLIRVLQGDLVGGIWEFLIGMFLRGAAAASLGETVARRLLTSVTIAQVMNPDPITVEARASLHEFIEDSVYRHHHRWFPVIDQGMIAGSVTTRQVASVDRAAWPSVPVGQIMTPLATEDVIAPEATAFAALSQMRKTGRNRLMVLQHGRLLGIVSSRDLRDIISLEPELKRDGKRSRMFPRPARPA